MLRRILPDFWRYQNGTFGLFRDGSEVPVNDGELTGTIRGFPAIALRHPVSATPESLGKSCFPRPRESPARLFLGTVLSERASVGIPNPTGAIQIDARSDA